MEEATIISDLIDDLIVHGFRADENNRLTVITDAAGYFCVSRSLNFIESDGPRGWAWPLTERRLDLMYERGKKGKKGLSTETYSITSGTIIHRPGAPKDPIANRFEIAFYGKKRQAVTSTITQPNLTEPSEPDHITRPTTPYDQAKLFDDLMDFDALLTAQNKDDIRSSNLK